MNRLAVVMLGVALIGSGCSVHLDPKVPSAMGAPREGSFGAESAARGMPSTVGHGTFTVFAIPVASVSISNGPGDRLVMDKVRETIAAAGYRVLDASAGEVSGRPVLQCGVTRFSFRNYTWLVPLVFTWGGIELDLKLVDSTGGVRWHQTYAGKSTNLTYSFSRAVNSSMSQILEKLAQDVSSDAFQRACCAAEVPTAAGGEE
jgi:hypothetical protein